MIDIIFMFLFLLQEHYSEAQQERLELQRARVLEVNRHLATLTDSWERGGLPLHMNLAVHHHSSPNFSPDMVSRLKQQNHLLTEVGRTSTTTDKQKQSYQHKDIRLTNGQDKNTTNGTETKNPQKEHDNGRLSNAPKQIIHQRNGLQNYVPEVYQQQSAINKPYNQIRSANFHEIPPYIIQDNRIHPNAANFQEIHRTQPHFPPNYHESRIQNIQEIHRIQSSYNQNGPNFQEIARQQNLSPNQNIHRVQTNLSPNGMPSNDPRLIQTHFGNNIPNNYRVQSSNFHENNHTQTSPNFQEIRRPQTSLSPHGLLHSNLSPNGKENKYIQTTSPNGPNFQEINNMTHISHIQENNHRVPTNLSPQQEIHQRIKFEEITPPTHQNFQEIHRIQSNFISQSGPNIPEINRIRNQTGQNYENNVQEIPDRRRIDKQMLQRKSSFENGQPRIFEDLTGRSKSHQKVDLSELYSVPNKGNKLSRSLSEVHRTYNYYENIKNQKETESEVTQVYLSEKVLLDKNTIEIEDSQTESELEAILYQELPAKKEDQKNKKEKTNFDGNYYEINDMNNYERISDYRCDNKNHIYSNIGDENGLLTEKELKELRNKRFSVNLKHFYQERAIDVEGDSNKRRYSYYGYETEKNLENLNKQKNKQDSVIKAAEMKGDKTIEISKSDLENDYQQNIQLNVHFNEIKTGQIRKPNEITKKDVHFDGKNDRIYENGNNKESYEKDDSYSVKQNKCNFDVSEKSDKDNSMENALENVSKHSFLTSLKEMKNKIMLKKNKKESPI